jgi:hypothetical protein
MMKVAGQSARDNDGFARIGTSIAEASITRMTEPFSNGRIFRRSRFRPGRTLALCALLGLPAAALACSSKDIRRVPPPAGESGEGGGAGSSAAGKHSGGTSGEAGTASQQAGAGTGAGGAGQAGESGAPAVGGESGEGSGGAPASEGGGAGQASGGEGGVVLPLSPGAPLVDTEVEAQTVDVFGTIGNWYWFVVSDEQLERMNGDQGGGPFPENGDIYVPGGSNATYVDHLLVKTAGENSTTADYGKTKVRVVGQSTYRPWSRTSIPNLNVETDEFTPRRRIGGFEHLRFGNGQVGSIYRERITLELYDLLGYPAPEANFAWVSSNVWSESIKIPYTIVERYKPDFCERNAERLGGGCVNMWEFVGDLNGGGHFPGRAAEARFIPGGGSQFDDPSLCQFSECDPTRVKEFESTVAATPEGDGFKAALADWIDWPMFHKFQCLSWILVTGDDALHNTNNVVLVERSDGKFGYLPYSVDISLGQDWYPAVELPGHNMIARGCQSDESCWADTIATCEDLVEKLIQLDPVGLVDEVHEALKNEGMIRPGDEQRYRALRDWFEGRLVALPEEIEWYREPPIVCDYPFVDCGGYCDYYENCGQCRPPVGKLAFAPEPGAGGAPGQGGGEGGDFGAAGAGGKPGECPMITNYAVD